MKRVFACLILLALIGSSSLALAGGSPPAQPTKPDTGPECVSGAPREYVLFVHYVHHVSGVPSHLPGEGPPRMNGGSHASSQRRLSQRSCPRIHPRQADDFGFSGCAVYALAK